MQSTDEVYFACKKAYQTLDGEELTAKLKEIFTPEIQAEMETKNKQYQNETRKMLNREYAKSQRDKTRVKKYGARHRNIQPPEKSTFSPN